MHYIRCYLFLTLLLFTNSMWAAIIREDFARMVDYAGWQLIDAYMQDYVRLRPDMVAEKEGYRLFQQTYNTSNYSTRKPPNSEAVRLFLISHEWRNAGINLYADFVNTKAAYQNDWSDAQATEFLQNKITAISPEALGAQSDADYTALQATKERLKIAVAQNFMGNTAFEKPTSLASSRIPGEAEVSDDTSFSALSDDTALASDSVIDDNTDRRGFVLPTTTEESTAGSLGMLSYAINPISLGAAVLLLLLLLYLFGLYKRLDDRVDKHSKRIEDLTTRLFLKKDPVSADDLKQLKAQVASLQEQIKKLKASPPSSSSETPSGAKPRPLVADQHEYYLSTPNSDGTFNTSSMSNQFRPSASVYKFMVTEANGTHRAEFTVASDHDAVKDALSSPGSYLDPVCESINPYFSGAKRIVNIRPGKAVKQGDKWVVKPEHKARIRYE